MDPYKLTIRNPYDPHGKTILELLKNMLSVEEEKMDAGKKRPKTNGVLGKLRKICLYSIKH